MSAVLIVASIIAALLVFVIAAVIIGREARRLDSVAPRVVYELEQATQFVADNLPSETQARLTYAELRKLLVFHMRWLHDKGLQPAGVVDRRQDIVDEVVIDEQTLTGYLLDFDAIGAIGPQSND
ncbi:MAG: hypothetical protein EB028_04465 [Actinobacteria bacterium]|nr:hypothetical protein [Actinomycetota bacterium]